jgi:SH3-like domain-containing protein|tara:strand:+ start:66 stop:434 length:369 start_codon:yes stop_codon:yes gene_type:complete
MSLKNKKVNVRYGPGLDYPIKFVFNKKNYPVEIIDQKENFRKILDFKKNSGWIHRSQLKKSSSFITLDTVILFSDSTKFSRAIAKIESGRLLNKKKCNLNWCRVETGEYKGWVLKESLWGLN